MKHLNLTIAAFLLMILVSCRTSQKFQAYAGEDKQLFKVINELNKKPGNTKAQAALQELYPQAKKFHEESIAAYEHSRDIKKFDVILEHLNAMQHIYTSIMATPGTSYLLKPKNYITEIEALREEAAAAHYEQGKYFAERDGRENSLEAYRAFKKANEFIRGYKDVSMLMKEQYEKSIIHVVINPIEDRNFSSWSSMISDFQYRPEDYQQSLVNELSSFNNQEYPAKFYTDREARRQRIQPDRVVQIQWINIDPLQSMPRSHNRQVSKQIQIGSDTAGKPVYKTVHATLQIMERVFTVRGELEYNVEDYEERRSLDYGRLSEDVSWSERYATYSGDSRALSSEDWALINNQNAGNRNVTKGEVMNTIMRKIYPDLRRRIQYSLN